MKLPIGQVTASSYPAGIAGQGMLKICKCAGHAYTAAVSYVLLRKQDIRKELPLWCHDTVQARPYCNTVPTAAFSWPSPGRALHVRPPDMLPLTHSLPGWQQLLAQSNRSMLDHITSQLKG